MEVQNLLAILFLPQCDKKVTLIRQLFSVIWRSNKEVIDLEWLKLHSASQEEYKIKSQSLYVEEKIKC